MKPRKTRSLQQLQPAPPTSSPCGQVGAALDQQEDIIGGLRADVATLADRLYAVMGPPPQPALPNNDDEPKPCLCALAELIDASNRNLAELGLAIRALTARLQV